MADTCGNGYTENMPCMMMMMIEPYSTANIKKDHFNTKELTFFKILSIYFKLIPTKISNENQIFHKIYTIKIIQI